MFWLVAGNWRLKSPGQSVGRKEDEVASFVQNRTFNSLRRQKQNTTPFLVKLCLDTVVDKTLGH